MPELRELDPVAAGLIHASLTEDKFATDRILTRAVEANLDGLFFGFTMANLAGGVLVYASPSHNASIMRHHNANTDIRSTEAHVSVRIVLSSWELPIGIEPMTYALRGACSPASHALTAPISWGIALIALAALELSGDAVHARGRDTPACSCYSTGARSGGSQGSLCTVEVMWLSADGSATGPLDR
jgi:hypothetical protein